MQKLLCFFSKRYHRLIEPKVNEYLRSKKLSMGDWMTAVKNNRCGDIVCVYLLSMVMGNHMAIHLKNNKIWCTLKTVPLLHHELVECCPIHLVYMGFGIFLQLKKRQIPESTTILGTILSEDSMVRVQLHLLIKTEKSDVDERLLRGNITTAAGSESQLHHVEQELNQRKSKSTAEGCTLCAIPKSEHQPKVKILPFSVNLIRLSDATIRKYTKQSECPTVKTIKTLHLKKLTIPVKRLLLTPSQSVFLQSPCKTASPNTATQPIRSTTNRVVKRKRYISGYPSRQQPTLTFQFQQHTLKSRKRKVYLKCRIPRCKLAYVTYHSVKSINAHHRIYHSGVTYTCEMCSKLLTMLTALKWHMYSHGNQAHKCDKCNKTFVYRSKLRQHRRSHLRQRLYQCCHRKCQQEYRHPQDLARHTLTHTKKTFECDLCEKTFKQKRLLRHHEAIHSATCRYFCQSCNKGFIHNNQLFRHRKSCN